jgi:hypothetical protein
MDERWYEQVVPSVRPTIHLDASFLYHLVTIAILQLSLALQTPQTLIWLRLLPLTCN